MSWSKPRDRDGRLVGVPRAVVPVVGRPLKVVVGGGERVDATAQGDIGEHWDVTCVWVGVHGHLVRLS